MKVVIISVLISMLSTVSYGKDIKTIKEIIGVPLAVEYRENNKFKNIVAKLEFDYGYGESIAIVTYGLNVFDDKKIMSFPTIYKITHKDEREENIYYFEGINQYDKEIAGILDVKNKTKPKVDLLMEGGMRIINITNIGRKYKKRHIPNIELGWDN